MTQRHKLPIEVLGLPDIELRVIKSICAISANRMHAYVVAETERATIQLVNADDAAAMRHLARIDPYRQQPTIYLTADGRPLGDHSLKRPVTPAALLRMLDSIAERWVSRTRPHDLAAASAAPAHRTAPAFHALVVDDSPTVRKQLELALSAMGGHVNTAETGERALAALETGGYDMVFLDVVLPGADGYQICKTIKRNRQHRSLPVVMLTSKSSPFDKVRGSLAGCDTYLTKPAERDTLQQVVQKYAPNTMRGSAPVLARWPSRAVV